METVTCPVCQKILDHMSETSKSQHVNKCADEMLSQEAIKSLSPSHRKENENIKKPIQHKIDQTYGNILSKYFQVKSSPAKKNIELEPCPVCKVVGKNNLTHIKLCANVKKVDQKTAFELYQKTRRLVSDDDDDEDDDFEVKKKKPVIARVPAKFTKINQRPTRNIFDQQELQLAKTISISLQSTTKIKGKLGQPKKYLLELRTAEERQALLESKINAELKNIAQNRISYKEEVEFPRSWALANLNCVIDDFMLPNFAKYFVKNLNKILKKECEGEPPTSKNIGQDLKTDENFRCKSENALVYRDPSMENNASTLYNGDSCSTLYDDTFETFNNNLINNKNFSDVTIVTKTSKLCAHKLFWCLRVNCDTKISVVDCSGHNERIVLMLLKYVYSGKLLISEITSIELKELYGLAMEVKCTNLVEKLRQSSSVLSGNVQANLSVRRKNSGIELNSDEEALEDQWSYYGFHFGDSFDDDK